MNKPYIVILADKLVSKLNGKYTTSKYYPGDLYNDVYLTKSEVNFLQLKYDIYFIEGNDSVIIDFNKNDDFYISALNELRPDHE